MRLQIAPRKALDDEPFLRNRQFDVEREVLNAPISRGWLRRRHAGAWYWAIG